MASRYLHQANLNKFVEFRKIFSTDSALEIEFREKFELIFLDANHSYSHAYRDLELAWGWLQKNGILVIDDVGEAMANEQCQEGRGGVRQALIDFSKANNLSHLTILEHPIWLNPCGIALLTK
jgi:predicted O-methyltransferase YrrM